MRVLLIIGLISLTGCSLYKTRIDMVNGWPCKNYTGFNTPEQTCQTQHVRTYGHRTD